MLGTSLAVPRFSYGMLRIPEQEICISIPSSVPAPHLRLRSAASTRDSSSRGVLYLSVLHIDPTSHTDIPMRRSDISKQATKNFEGNQQARMRSFRTLLPVYQTIAKAARLMTIHPQTFDQLLLCQYDYQYEVLSNNC